MGLWKCPACDKHHMGKSHASTCRSRPRPPAPAPFRPPHGAPRRPTSSPDPDSCSCLSAEDIAQHRILWKAVPPSALFDWTTACRPRFAALLDAHSSSDNPRIGAAFDSILQAPAVFLVRNGGSGARFKLFIASNPGFKLVLLAESHPPAPLSM